VEKLFTEGAKGVLPQRKSAVFNGENPKITFFQISLATTICGATVASTPLNVGWRQPNAAEGCLRKMVNLAG
jgi:hypothetical protein